MKWADIVKRDDIVGGEIENHKDRYIYRGPICSIKIENEQVYIETLWMAWRSENTNKDWTPWVVTSYSFSASIEPVPLGNYRLIFSMSPPGFSLIIPMGGDKLDPAKVKGLKVPQS